MKILTEPPYSSFNGYIVTSKSGRKSVCLVNGKTRTTVSYARYLMSVKTGRLLNDREQVDHIDENKSNDDISNLQILSPEENREKYISNRCKKTLVILICPECFSVFAIRKSSSFEKKGSKFHCCSKKCLHGFLKTRKTGIELESIGKDQIIDHSIVTSSLRT